VVLMYGLRGTRGDDRVLVGYVAQCSVPLSRMSRKYLSRYGDLPRLQASAQSILKSVPGGDGVLVVSTSFHVTETGCEVVVAERMSSRRLRLSAQS